MGNGDATVQVIVNVEAGNYYSKSTFIVTLIKHKKLVFVLVILCIQEYVLQNCLRGLSIGRFPISGIRFPK